ncbi:hypothetical protein F3Y22_tig00111671pilonHSYRG00094 [Hibiscus syriacus]|uniref:Kinesin-like protein n=1 Tax=Hibiscus syriacus TaxID=106335 RepID=A0A6A2XYF2_HIBSY|nr:hypothetical protein F3Y22_tig00111671pilonHSYRG00094 [Hibiscus syriacus]
MCSDSCEHVVLDKVENRESNLLRILIEYLKKEHEILSSQVKSFLAMTCRNSSAPQNDEHELLKKKYLHESSERKRLYNEVIELKGNIRMVSSDSSKKQFNFDHVFRPDDGQEAVFARTKPIVTSVLDGYNVCIFAYGQTGTGKTFTMEEHQITGDMMEVYNEKIKDLLGENSNQTTKRLEIKQAAEGTQEVPGLVQARVYNTEEVWKLLKSGSRLLRVTVKGTNLINGQKTRSHLWLVDLAGSERVGKIEAEGLSPFLPSYLITLMQTQHITQRIKNQETKKLQDNVQSLQLRLAAREHICRTLQEKVRDLEIQLAEERKTRIKLETRAFSAAAAASTRSSLKQEAEKTKMEKKPPVVPSKLRLPLRKINNFMPMPTTPMPNNRKTTRMATVPEGKENNLKNTMAPRRNSIAVRPPTTMKAVFQPMRRLSVSAFRPDSHMTTPLCNSTSGFNHASTMDRPSLMRDVRKARYSRLFSPLPKLRNPSETTPAAMITTKTVRKPKRRVSIATFRPDSHMKTPLRSSTAGFNYANRLSLMRDPKNTRYSRLFSPSVTRYSRLFPPSASETTTPAAMRSSSKFMGSPPMQAGSWKPTHPTVVALQRKSLVWSPLKFRRTQRKQSFMPLRPSAERQ